MSLTDLKHCRVENEKLKAENARLATEVAELKERQEWRPIESAPKDGSEVLLWTVYNEMPGLNVPTFSCAQVGRWWEFGEKWETQKMDTPTHWMPLPDPPEVSS